MGPPPRDPHGAIGTARFRWTLAWHIARCSGSLVALAVQCGHLRTATGAGYATRGRDGIRELLDTRPLGPPPTPFPPSTTISSRGRNLRARRAASIHVAAQVPTFAGSIRTHHRACDILGNPALTIYDNPRSFLMCLYNRDRALCHRLDAADAPRLDRCQPSCAKFARTPRRAEQLRQHVRALEKQAAFEALSGPLADRLVRRAGQLRSCPTAMIRTEIICRSRPHESSP
ncbi:hypothetical protein [Streptomyces sp. NPDC058701]|uniref:hypothetical protein n=1 Tax=Streptomyces sp. NPDC058701 TaxID=3346608 RepID=UPI0036470250